MLLISSKGCVFMIRSQLSTLLAERSLKITKVSNDTGISRTTLTALNQNENKMVQMVTINTLCNYLKVTPAEFFEYSPLDASFYFELGDVTTTNEELSHGEPLEINANGFINFTKYGDKFGSIEFKGSLLEYGIVDRDAQGNDVLLYGVFLNPVSETSKYFDDLSISLQTQIKNDYSKFIEKKLTKEWKKDNNDPAKYEIAISFDADKPASFKSENN